MPIGRVAKDMSGQRFERLVLLKLTRIRKGGHAVYLCRCDCGVEKEVSAFRLRNGSTKSCGCLARERSSKRETVHGLTKHPLFPTWCAMMNRCYSPLNAAYPRYGGRGILVCDRWHSVENFIADNEAKALTGLSIDRIDNSGNYTPENTRWATRLQQSRNRKSNVMLTYDGQTMTLFEWAEKVGIAPRTLWARIRASGWTVERALTEPVRK